MLTINKLNDMKDEIGLYGRKVIEDYICAMVHVSTDVMRNRTYSTADRKEKELYIAMEPFCTAHGIRLDELRKVLDDEANRRIYVRKRMEKKGSAA